MTDTTTAPAAPAAPAAKRPSLWHRLYHGETTYNFIGRQRIGLILSGVLIAVSLLSLFTRGLNLGIDFEGGVAWELPAAGLTDTDARAVLDENGIAGEAAKIQTLGSGSDERLRVQVAPQPADVQQKVRQELATRAGVANVQDVSVTSVGPTWGEEITRKAVRALVFFFIAVALYISLRFEWRMAVGALAAVVHDVLISVGIYSLFGFEVTPATVIAFLTILGYSLYDTIVVFDKVHENVRRYAPTGRVTYSDIVNLSMNQVLMRSLNTSVAALLPVLSLLVVGSWWLGAVALRDFALALAIGLVTGAYSSIFIATPILAWLKEREPRYAKLRQKLGRRTAPPAEVRTVLATAAGAALPGRGSRRARATSAAGSAAAATPAAGATSTAGSAPSAAPAGDDELVAAASTSAPAASTPSGPAPRTVPVRRPSHPPRPRKKKRR